jgi:hypothetical protein
LPLLLLLLLLCGPAVAAAKSAAYWQLVAMMNFTVPSCPLQKPRLAFAITCIMKSWR